MTALKQVPPWAWVVLTAVAGLSALAYHRWARDDDDQDWTTAKETQAPVVANFPQAPAMHGTCSTKGCRHDGSLAVHGAFRARAYPGSLAAADFSIIGEV